MPTRNAISPEQRQRINLSQYAFDIVRNDELTFIGKINDSGFICKILYNCGEAYFDDTDIKNKDSALRAYPKFKSVNIRLNNNIINDYYPDDGKWFGAKYKMTQGQYIKAVIEDYARKTFFEREGIFFKDTILKLESHINNPDSNKGLLPIIYKEGQKYYIKPYRLSNNYEGHFHYLICMSARSGDGDMKPEAIRLTRIKDIKPAVTSYGTGRIKAKEEKELERRIRENGVPYVSGETIDVVVSLTPKGMSMYNSIFHQRPIYTSIDKGKNGNTRLTFHATERQITNYFFQFGKEALIHSPVETREWVRNRYNAALESYDNSPLFE